ncbi:AAA family ATPase [Actinomadura sp. K4S16]|uniref:AAA family ATPase n=1 Tax=Actinomadura sp. K4S16 TaxID=1316147 RepID=UPI0011F059B8|nr:AAA family ATPase [Actinomadura sp. K4S16]
MATVEQDGFAFLALTGELGAGKTRLLRALADVAGTRWLVLMGQAPPVQPAQPWGAVADALDGYLLYNRPALAGPVQELLAELAHAADRHATPDVTEAPDRGEAPEGEGEEGARLLLRPTVRRLLEQLAAPSGLVLILDDLHWADSTTLALLDDLVRHPPLAKILVAVAYRSGQASARLTALIKAAELKYTSITIPALTPDQGEDLLSRLGSYISPDQQQALYRASQGNPLYLEALGRMAQCQDDVLESLPYALPSQRAPMLPPHLATVLTLELRLLSTSALQVAWAAAVIGRDFEVMHAAAVAELSPQTAQNAVDDLCAHGIIQPVTGGRFAFRHQLLRHAAYACSPSDWRQTAHARALMSSETPSPEQISSPPTPGPPQTARNTAVRSRALSLRERWPDPLPGQGKLVGRGDALHALGRALDAPGFGFVAVVGEPGAGKTRLLNELADGATTRRLPFLAGRAAEFEQEMPFGAVVDALDDQLEERAPELGPVALQLLGAVFPALGGIGPAATPPAASSHVARYQLHRTIRHLLEELAGPPGGLVLILDDLHWADDATIELLDHLVRHPPRARLLVAVAYRPAQASPRLAALVAAAGPQGTYVAVNPLTQSEVEEFLGPDVGQTYREALYKATGGNPFYLEALVRMKQDDASSASDGAEWQDKIASLPGVPPAVRTALQVELRTLPEQALLLARGAAVAADVFEPSLAAVAAEIDQAAALAALDVLTAHDVVRPAPGGRFRFRHPLVRHVVYASTAAGWRVAAHARLAEHLAEVGAPTSVRAHHVVRSARFGDRTAIGTLVDAARVVSLQAPRTAAYWLEAALALLPEEADAVADRLELLLELAHVQAVSGNAATGLETARTLLGLLPATDTARRARTIQLCAVMERQLGRIHESRAIVLDELRRITDRQMPEAVLLRLRLVSDRMQRADILGARAVLDTIANSAPERGPGLAAAVASMRPMAAYAAGDIADAIAYIDTADRLLSTATDIDLADCLENALWLVRAETFIGMYDSALRHVERLITIARAQGQTYILGYMLAAQARALALIGRIGEATASADESAAVGRELRSAEVLAYGLTEQCLLTSWRGDHDHAVQLGAEAVAQDHGSGEWWTQMAHVAHAYALINAGRQEEGADMLIEACSDVVSPRLDRSTLVMCAETLASIRSGQDRSDQARKWADIAATLTTPELGGDIGVARLAEAHAIRCTDPALAARTAAEAAEILTAAGRRPDAGRAELAAGTAYGVAGQRAPARERLRAAAEVFESCGMRALHAQAVREQRRLGVRIPGASRSGKATARKGEAFLGLSPREWEIALLVADGHSNQQIAGRLYLSVRTVETHLSKIFTKIGVASRVGVATAVNRQQL